MTQPLLELRGINKSFGVVHVLHDVDFAVYPGQVTALVGDNGAGKSTLVKVIAGIYGRDSGDYIFDGEPVTVHGPRDVAALAIEVVYQDLALCDNLDIVQNMFLGREETRGVALDEATMEARARDTLGSLSVRTVSSVRQHVASLSGGQRQTVAIAKAVLWNSKIVLLDEPTAALGVAQTRQVLDLVRRLADRGLGVVLISHNMGDVFEVADRITALYLGRVAADVATKDVTHGQVVELITAGRSGDLGIAEPRDRDRLKGRAMTVETDQPADTAGFAEDSRRSVTLRDAWTDYVNRLRGGDMGSLPAILGLVVLYIVFGLANDRFLSMLNQANLVIQAGSICVLAMGLVFVLLLGEIDLSAGVTGGVSAAFTALAVVDHGQPWWAAILIGMLVGAAIGFASGCWWPTSASRRSWSRSPTSSRCKVSPSSSSGRAAPCRSATTCCAGSASRTSRRSTAG